LTETVKDCNYPWTWIVVTADGMVKPCCYAPGQLGNLNVASPEDVWNGPDAVELRHFIIANKVHPICKGAACKFVQNMLPSHPVAVGDGAADVRHAGPDN
jgi:MoaA/NifB/PqqE/SkfB family radical SAM enzyme